MNNTEREKAEEYLNSAKEYIEKASKSSNTYKETKAEIYIIDAENLCHLENLTGAKKSLDKAYAIIKDYPKSNMNASYCLSEGYYFYKMKQYENALKSYDKGIANSMLFNDIYSANRLKLVKYHPLKAMNRYEDIKNMLSDLIESGSLLAVDEKDILWNWPMLLKNWEISKMHTNINQDILFLATASTNNIPKIR